jgi:hypothetical protein
LILNYLRDEHPSRNSFLSPKTYQNCIKTLLTGP